MSADGSSIKVSTAAVAAYRLRHHHLARRTSREALAAVARDAGGIHAQVFSAAKLSLWARTEGLTPRDVERALWDDRSLVKTWVMRGTVHLVSAEDLAIYLAGLRKESLLREQGWMRRYGLRQEDFREMPRAAERALASGPLTRRELAESVVQQVGERARPWVEHGYGGVVRLATLQGRVCFGAPRGQEITFVLLDDWLPNWSMMPSEQAEAELLRRYLHAYGPATPQDFAAWSGMRVRTSRDIWKRAEDGLQRVTVDGKELFLLAEEVDELFASVEAGTSVRLLPYFDVYLLGHRDKGHLVDAIQYKRVYRKAGWISQAVLVDGQVAGVWTQKGHGKRLAVTVEPFEPLDGAVRQAVEEEATDLGRFLGQKAEVVFA